MHYVWHFHSCLWHHVATPRLGAHCSLSVCPPRLTQGLTPGRRTAGRSAR